MNSYNLAKLLLATNSLKALLVTSTGTTTQDVYIMKLDFTDPSDLCLYTTKIACTTGN